MSRDGADRILVLLVDDHPVLREGLALLLNREDIAVFAEAASRTQVLQALEPGKPHVALLDLSLGSENGLELIGLLDERGIPILVYSMHEEGELVQRTLAAGARGYVTKRELHEVLVEAIREVAAGREFLGPRAASALAAHLARTGYRQRRDHRELSERESEVYRLLGEGATTSEIASVLRVSTRTVESYCARIMEKLGMDGMRRLRRDAIHHGQGGSQGTQS